MAASSAASGPVAASPAQLTAARKGRVPRAIVGIDSGGLRLAAVGSPEHANEVARRRGTATTTGAQSTISISLRRELPVHP